MFYLWLYLKQWKILNILVNIKDIFFRVWILVLDRIQKTANCTSQTEKAVGTSWSFMFYVTNQLFTIECAVLYYHFMANWKQSYSLDSAEGKVNWFHLQLFPLNWLRSVENLQKDVKSCHWWVIALPRFNPRGYWMLVLSLQLWSVTFYFLSISYFALSS